ncbi:hypothetical protein GGP62_001002 [Salinibacter ruber]|nr:hypothetical protein [Salinibacter ruber]
MKGNRALVMRAFPIPVQNSPPIAAIISPPPMVSTERAFQESDERSIRSLTPRATRNKPETAPAMKPLRDLLRFRTYTARTCRVGRNHSS